jgi:hypothetical protein
MIWNFEEARKQLEYTIDSMVERFLEKPYTHRVEHSLHCELFKMLSDLDFFNKYYKTADGYETQLIQKEWPETIAQDLRRRGNFDLVILSPEDIEKSSLADFVKGKITPTFVIELSLNYQGNHLEKDLNKMVHSNCENGYIVHLDNGSHYKKSYDKIHDLIKDYRGKKIKIAYAAKNKDGIQHMKYLHGELI